ncbi:hypothetical protein CLOM621_06614 [Clostridium sp. M62/1]|nr:hypothetical protein CLOM621_06614 [Clostridium sp. M62/1]
MLQTPDGRLLQKILSSAIRGVKSRKTGSGKMGLEKALSFDGGGSFKSAAPSMISI